MNYWLTDMSSLVVTCYDVLVGKLGFQDEHYVMSPGKIPGKK